MRIAVSLLMTAFVLTGAAAAGEAVDLDAGGQLAERHEVLDGAEADLADARAYLSQLEAGNFAGIFAIADDGAMRCGEVEANSACAPLTAQDKAEALAEAREMLAAAKVQLADAREEIGDHGRVENAGYTP